METHTPVRVSWSCRSDVPPEHARSSMFAYWQDNNCGELIRHANIRFVADNV